MIVTFPFVRKVRELYPASQIDYLINGSLRDIISCLSPEVDRVISGSSYITKTYDIVYNLQELSRKAFQLRQGEMHQLDIFCEEYNFNLTNQEKQATRRLNYKDSVWGYKYLQYYFGDYQEKTIIGIVLTDRCSQKVWPYNNELIDCLSSDKDKIFLLLGHSLYSNKRFNKERILNVTELTSLSQVISLINCCNLVIAPDTGLLHVAGVLNIPFIGLFGSTPGKLITRYYKSCYCVIQKQLCESICWQRNFASCNNCLKSISVKEVVDVINAISER